MALLQKLLGLVAIRNALEVPLTKATGIARKMPCLLGLGAAIGVTAVILSLGILALIYQLMVLYGVRPLYAYAIILAVIALKLVVLLCIARKKARCAFRIHDADQCGYQPADDHKHWNNPVNAFVEGLISRPPSSKRR